MTPEQTKLFEEYEQLKILIRDAEDRVEEIKPLIVDLVPTDKEMLTEKGYFYIQMKEKWTYSSDLQAKEKDVKAAKKREEADGTAKSTPSKVLYYKSGVPEEREEVRG